MVANSYRLNVVSNAVIVVFLLFVESAHWLTRIGINFDGSTINFGECLDFNVVAPDFILSFAVAVAFQGAVDAPVNEVFEIITAGKNVVYAFLSQEITHVLVTVNLKGYRTKQAISITFHAFNDHLTLVIQLVSKLFFLLIPKLDKLLFCQLFFFIAAILVLLNLHLML